MSRKGFIAVICLWVLMAFNWLPASAADRNRDLFISYSLDVKTLYEREGAVLTVNLYSTEPDIAFAECLNIASLDKGEFSYITNLDYSRRARREVIDGKEYFVFTLNAYLICMHDNGSYTLRGAEYEIGVNVPMVYDDPFWGRTRAAKTESFRVKADPFKFKVKELPRCKAEDSFSGAVGDFQVSTTIPPGDIVLNQEATAIITLKGRGLLGKDIMPEYLDAFSRDVALKSVSENRDSYFDGKGLVSVLTLECEFIPKSKDAEIGPVSFGFFNPNTGKYEKAVSDSVSINAKSIASQKETIEV